MEAFNKPSTLSLSGNLAENWRRFEQQFEIYVAASDKEKASDAIKVALLLNFAGEDAIEVFNTFKFTNEADKKVLKTVKEKFEEYCNPRKNVVFERYVYWKTIQQDEPIDHFVTTLKQKIKSCEYPAAIVDDMVRDKLVFGVRDDTVKERLLRENDLTLNKALGICRASEQSKEHLKQMKSAQSQACEVDSISRRRQEPPVSKKEKPWKCKFCGTSHKPRACPAYGKTCNWCKKVGHFESECFSKKKNVNAIAESHPDEDEAKQNFCYSVESNGGQPDYSLTATVDGKPLTMKIDTGADVNVLSITKLRDLGLASKIENRNYSLTVYGGDKVKVVGKVSLACQYKNKFCVLTFCVVDKNSPAILGKPGIEEFGLIKRIYNVENDDPLLQEFSDVFKGLGLIKDVEYKIRLKPDAVPVVHPPRKVPAKVRPLLKDELDRMEKMNVIEKVNPPTDWVNSLVVVRKKNNKLRVCMDPSDLNKCIMREHYPMKSVEEVVSRMPEAQIFTVLDANHGFWQVKLSEDSKHLCTFNTPFGRYAFKRLPFGICSAPEVYQRIMTQLFDDIDGCEVIVDDLLIWGRDTEEHDERLRKVLERARSYNVKLNMEKCQLRRPSVTYIGHQLTASGLKPDPNKIAAIEKMSYPQSKEELQRYLGMVTYLAKFIENMSNISAPLRELLEKDVDWHWDERHSAAFNQLKTAITSAPVLKYFDPNLPITLSVDASSKGLGAVIMHNEAPIAYASRAMTAAEQNYAQIEREMLAITFGCQRFHDYLYGQEMVNVETDHKPLEAINKKPIHCASPRIQRMLLKIQPYALSIKYKPGKELHIADALSRDYMQDTTGTPEKDLEVYHVLEAGEMSINGYNDLVQATKMELKLLHNLVMNGWPENKKDVPEAASCYWTFRDELYEQDGILYKSDRVIVPPSLQNYVLNNLHYGHSGCERTKEKARQSVFWPGINKAIDHMIQRCSACLEYSRQQQREPMIPHSVPDRPWQVVGMDHFYFNGQDYLLLVDYFSKYPEVAQVSRKTAAATINKTKEILARHGKPEKIVADNMPFNSREFRLFSKEWNIKMVTSSPKYYRSHGLVERHVGIIKQMLKKCKESGDDPYLALLELRNTPLTGIGYSPAELLMSRRLRTSVPMRSDLLQPKVVEDARERLLQRQSNHKQYYDRGTRALPPVATGDTVRIHDGTSWKPGIVTGEYNTPRSYKVVTAEGQHIRRNRAHLLATKEPRPMILPEDVVVDHQRSDVDQDRDSTAESENEHPVEAPSHPATMEQGNSQPVQRTRSGRIIRAPQRYQP